MSEPSLSMRLSYKEPLHGFLKKALLARIDMSKRKMSDYHTRWDDVDDQFRAYLKEDDEAKLRRDRKKYDGRTDYVALEVPYSYAVVSTFHTYMSSVFLSRVPIYQLSGRHGESQNQVMAVEAMMGYQAKVGRHLPVLFNWLYDMSKFSVGIIGNYWEVEERTASRIVEVPKEIGGVPIEGKTMRVKERYTAKGYEGNKLFNVRPYDFRPDPRVTLANHQDGEFCGHRSSAGWHHLEGDPTLINLDTLRKVVRNKSNEDREEGSSRVELPNQPGEDNVDDQLVPGWANLEELYVKLVPKTWKLGESDRMEIWKFTLAEREVIIEARPLGLFHGKFPYSVIESGFGAEEFVKMSQMEYIRPLTDIMSWLFNSHFHAVRNSLNDKKVVDPSRVHMPDVQRLDRPFIRLRPEAYGADTRTAVTQLKVAEPTGQHLASAQYVEQMIQRASGVVDNLMGVVNQGGRKTATEVRNSAGMATNRLKTVAEYCSALGWTDLMEQMVTNTQQLYDGEMKLNITGNLAEGAPQILQVTPDQLAGSYDFVMVDGSMPIDRLAQANFWKEMIGMLLQSEGAAMQWDVMGMVTHAMHLQGERNVDRFRIQVRPDQAIAQDQAAGNVVPLGGASGGRSGTSGGIV